MNNINNNTVFNIRYYLDLAKSYIRFAKSSNTAFCKQKYLKWASIHLAKAQELTKLLGD